MRPEAVISSVTVGGIAERLGLVPGDRIQEVNGVAPQDVVDFMFMTASDTLELKVETGSGATRLLEIMKDPDEGVGVDFEEAVFDGMRACRNRCVFCFVDMLPPGLRRELYFKDDDYRLSFLHGNFISMTNMDEKDLERISMQGLSPLYVSVHATDGSVRERMMGNPRAGRIMEDLRDLTSRGIRVHAQVVVCPGMNDGSILEATIADLASLWPGVRSVGIVPVGIGWRCPASVRPLDEREARALVEWVPQRQEYFLRGLGYPFVFLADEVYVRAGTEFPRSECYADWPQVENGIGLASSFLDDFGASAHRLKEAKGSFTIVTGLAAKGILDRVAHALEGGGLDLNVVPVPNRLFGERVTVSGLLPGRDIWRALEGTRVKGKVLVPAVALRSQGDLFLDGVTPLEVQGRLGVPLEVVPATGRGLVKALLGGVEGRSSRCYRRKTQCR